MKRVRLPSRTMDRLHALAALAACVVVPGLSWLDGSGRLAWTMYSASGSYRLRIVALRADGSRRPMAPTSLAQGAGSELVPYLTGGERWRVAPAGVLDGRLADLAPLACRHRDADAVEITLETKHSLDAPIRSTTARVPCRASPEER